MSIFEPAIAITYRATIQFTGEVLGGVPETSRLSHPQMKCHFHRLGSHPALHARQIKACLKEAVSLLTLDRKAFTNRVFIGPSDLFRLEGGQPQYDLVRQRFINVEPGPRTAVQTDVYERLLTPAATFELSVEGDYISHDDWARIWNLAEGLGMCSFHGTYGQFKLVKWERTDD